MSEQKAEGGRQKADGVTRLEKLCELHGQQGGTIWQFNWRYGFDFLEMTDEQFAVWCMGFEAGRKECKV